MAEHLQQRAIKTLDNLSSLNNNIVLLHTRHRDTQEHAWASGRAEARGDTGATGARAQQGRPAASGSSESCPPSYSARFRSRLRFCSFGSGISLRPFVWNSFTASRGTSQAPSAALGRLLSWAHAGGTRPPLALLSFQKRDPTLPSYAQRRLRICLTGFSGLLFYRESSL